jgi:hypothetical protein
MQAFGEKRIKSMRHTVKNEKKPKQRKVMASEVKGQASHHQKWHPKERSKTKEVHPVLKRKEAYRRSYSVLGAEVVSKEGAEVVFK